LVLSVSQIAPDKGIEDIIPAFAMLKKEIPQTNWDDIGNIGKRYRRQDEIGTPFCLTIDFDTLKDETLTIRARDTGQQERVAVSKVIDYIKERL